MSYALGIKALRRLCIEQSPMAWQKAKLSPALFKPYEVPCFQWVETHLKDHHVLPQLETLQANFPDVAQLETPEPATYYVQRLEHQHFYELINQANLDAQALLKTDQDNYEKALEVLTSCAARITAQKFRLRILDVGKEAGDLVTMAFYAAMMKKDQMATFGWPYLDDQGNGGMPGDVISFVGRPAAGKTWLTLWTALHNWKKKHNVLFVSMEMMTLPVAQRITALYAHQNIQQLKMGAYSTPTMKKFQAGLKCMAHEEAKFYVIDGNLAASAEDIFMLADMLECPIIIIDGAYLLRHKNFRLDRFQRAAENIELIKRLCTDQDAVCFCSWQFNRQASEKQKKGKGETGDLEDIGYSDAIGQISSIALGLFQQEGLETVQRRKIRVLKGRNGELGQFAIAWDFNIMNFEQVDPPPKKEEAEPEMGEEDWV